MTFLHLHLAIFRIYLLKWEFISRSLGLLILLHLTELKGESISGIALGVLLQETLSGEGSRVLGSVTLEEMVKHTDLVTTEDFD